MSDEHGAEPAKQLQAAAVHLRNAMTLIRVIRSASERETREAHRQLRRELEAVERAFRALALEEATLEQKLRHVRFALDSTKLLAMDAIADADARGVSLETWSFLHRELSLN
ncbi:MAG TPA: hypothetical protein VGM90_16330 [Kofleriaceae bacterium]|jgi:hypothetical protein